MMIRTLAAVAGVAIGAAQPSAPDPVLNTRAVVLDGISIRVRTSELSARDPKLPVVVFENGGGMSLETWDKVLPAIARSATVVAYDRSGTGQSEWDGQPPTPERTAARLRRLLAHLGVGPPFVVVGHSWGGALARRFAVMHPADVAAVLYLDPTDITVSRADMVALFESIGSNAAGWDLFLQMQQKFLPPSGPVRAEALIIIEAANANTAQRTAASGPGVRSSVILAGSVAAPPQGSLPFDTKAFAAAFYGLRVARLKDWAANGGTFEIASKAGHFVQMDDPDRVIEAIRRLMLPPR